MWKIQMPSGEFLDTPPGFALTFELQNQVFAGSSSEVLPGSFSFPADVPLTGQNKKLLGHPHRPDNAAARKSWPDVRVYADGVAMFVGELKIRSATNTKASINITINALSGLKDKLLTDIDLGGERTIGAWETFAIYQKIVARNSNDYDFTFFQVEAYNPVGPGLYYNRFDRLTGEFDESGSILTPFVRLSYLLNRAFSQYAPGYTFDNAWQGFDPELLKLYIFNNVDCRVLTSYTPYTVTEPETLNLQKHVPKIKFAEFLKYIIAQWGLGVFVNVWDKKIRLAPLQEVLSRQPKHDWTPYALAERTIEDASGAPGFYNYKQASDVLPEMPAIETMPVFLSDEDWDDRPTPLAQGYYYLEFLSVVVEVNASGFVRFVGLYHRGERPGAGPDYQVGMECLLDYYGFGLRTVGGEASRWYIVDDAGTTKYEWRDNPAPIALMLYRGWQDHGIGFEPMPVAQNHVWDSHHNSPDRVEIAENGTPVATARRSLNWFGEYGLYNTAHRAWSAMLRNGKHVTQTFVLPLGVLVAFSFEDKIRVGNMEYFLKKLRVQKLLGKGKVLVEASMVSII